MADHWAGKDAGQSQTFIPSPYDLTDAYLRLEGFMTV
jgi:hypothetical protein